MLALLSVKIVLGEKMLPSVWNQVLEQTKYKNFPLGKEFQRHIKTIENQAEVQRKTIEGYEKQPVIK